MMQKQERKKGLQVELLGVIQRQRIWGGRGGGKQGKKRKERSNRAPATRASADAQDESAGLAAGVPRKECRMQHGHIERRGTSGLYLGGMRMQQEKNVGTEGSTS